MRQSFIEGLLKFNRRVLIQGVPAGQTQLAELADLIMFNKIFLDNMNEVFQRHYVPAIVKPYNKMIQIYQSNIARIISLCNGLKLSYDDWPVTELNIEWDNITFSDGIYGVVCNNGHIGVCKPDLSLNIDGMRFWKSELVVYQALLEYGSPVIIKVTKCDGQIVKVEYSGQQRAMNKIKHLFGNAVIIRNKYLYIDDLLEAVNQFALPRREVSRLQPIGPLNIIKRSMLIEFPNDSFQDYLGLLKAAVNHRETSRLYITFYRIGTDPELYYIIRQALRNGIKVHINIELHARGEEEVNKQWAEKLRSLGCLITTFGNGLVKVHSKLTLITFQSGKSVCQIGTGNYHTKTTSKYTDLSLMTSDDNICNQVKSLFQYFATGVEPAFNNNLLVTRFNARNRLIELINQQGSLGSNGYMCFKCNALDDDEIIYYLNEAAKKGCRINLIVRGVCSWVPQLNNVSVKSIVWAKLEHSRVYAFGLYNPVLYMGSLDLVTKKLDYRIETLVRVRDADTEIAVVNYLNRYIRADGWLMDKGGDYHQI